MVSLNQVRPVGIEKSHIPWLTNLPFPHPSKPSFQTVTHCVCLASVLVCSEHGNPEPSTSGWGQEITHTVTCLPHFLLPPISFTPHNIPLWAFSARSDLAETSHRIISETSRSQEIMHKEPMSPSYSRSKHWGHTRVQVRGLTAPWELGPEPVWSVGEWCLKQCSSSLYCWTEVNITKK